MKKILLVDDEEDILEFLKYNLEQEKFEVLVSSNGRDALKKMEHNPDLIVLDIMMPGMDGFELYKHIKSDKNYHHIPVIFLTAKAGETDEINTPFSPFSNTFLCCLANFFGSAVWQDIDAAHISHQANLSPDLGFGDAHVQSRRRIDGM